MAWAVAQGLLQGNADGTLDLDGAVTRAQAATVVARLHQAAPTEETPVEEAPAEETPAEEVPAEETPAEETPVEETTEEAKAA